MVCCLDLSTLWFTWSERSWGWHLSAVSSGIFCTWKELAIHVKTLSMSKKTEEYRFPGNPSCKFIWVNIHIIPYMINYMVNKTLKVEAWSSHCPSNLSLALVIVLVPSFFTASECLASHWLWTEKCVSLKFLCWVPDPPPPSVIVFGKGTIFRQGKVVLLWQSYYQE